ncbi:uncharacterized protein Dyak_GE28601 [Drosophila yakuba]|uniref:Uncharacterized protein n=1 Tax=Drosophila yakuba TaxID=7245 RepID=A0A0R1DP86_DROYA|nr:uncharacterized protein Dyak_GE28601 [Drosophila yakuba]
MVIGQMRKMNKIILSGLEQYFSYFLLSYHLNSTFFVGQVQKGWVEVPKDNGSSAKRMPSRMQQCQQQGPNERRRTCRAISFSVIIRNLCDNNQQIVININGIRAGNNE